MTFVEELDATKAASEGTLEYILVPRADYTGEDSSSDEEDNNKENETRAPTQKSHHVLWLPTKFTQEYARIKEECAGEYENFKTELDAQKKAKAGISEKLCTTLALTKILSEDGEWMMEDESKAALLVKQLAAHWRVNILKKTDDKLGLGAKPEPAAQAEGRVALYALLDQYKPELSMDGDSSLFTYEPAAKKGSRSRVSSTSSQ